MQVRWYSLTAESQPHAGVPTGSVTKHVLAPGSIRAANGRHSSVLRTPQSVAAAPGFDDFAEAQCASCYAETMGRSGLPPRIYFRLLLIA